MTASTRTDDLIDLADAINSLLEYRTSSEIVEARQPHGKGTRRIRRRHTTRHPSLLASLRDAAASANGDVDSAAGHESKLPGSLEALSALRTLDDGAAMWARNLGIDARHLGLERTLRRFVSAAFTDNQLTNLRRDAQRWVRQAEVVTGWTVPSRKINQPCPNCWRRHALVVTGDLDHALCSHCGAEWDHHTIGLLGEMLRVNQQHEVLAITRCDHQHGEWICVQTAGHAHEHRDGTGHWWANNDERIAQ